MHSGWTLALSCFVLCLSMQNFAPVSACQAWLWIHTVWMHHLVFHILPKIVGLQTNSKQPPAHINKVHINRKDKAGKQNTTKLNIFSFINQIAAESVSSVECHQSNDTKLPSSTSTGLVSINLSSLSDTCRICRSSWRCSHFSCDGFPP